MSELDKLKKLIDNHKIISFDIFETLLLSPFGSNQKQFFKYISEYKKNDDFVDLRIKSEKSARIKNLIRDKSSEDVNLDDIYSFMDNGYATYKYLEMDMFQDILRLNPFIKIIYDYALEKNKIIYIISDTYFSSEYIETLLKKNGIIECIGDSVKGRAKKTFNANGALVTPGLIDCHTHFIYGGSREDEMYNIISGHMSYSDIIKSGYGILSTVKDTRSQTENALYKKSIPILDKMLHYGTTTVEGKSGYGLTIKDEIKILKVMKKLNNNHKIDIVSTFMGGHVIPEEYKNDRASYINLICNEMIPEISKLGIAEFCDVFCENCGLDMEETHKVLMQGITLAVTFW